METVTVSSSVMNSASSGSWQSWPAGGSYAYQCPWCGGTSGCCACVSGTTVPSGYTCLSCGVWVVPNGSATHACTGATPAGYTCLLCGVWVVPTLIHSCTGTSGTFKITTGTTTVTNPTRECAGCDAELKYDEKMLCRECKGVFDAWRFLSKPSEEKIAAEKAIKYEKDK